MSITKTAMQKNGAWVVSVALLFSIALLAIAALSVAGVQDIQAGVEPYLPPVGGMLVAAGLFLIIGASMSKTAYLVRGHSKERVIVTKKRLLESIQANSLASTLNVRKEDVNVRIQNRRTRATIIERSGNPLSKEHSLNALQESSRPLLGSRKYDVTIRKGA